MEFEWDPSKARANLIKHGVAFEDATLVFGDPLHLSRQDRHESGEERWQSLGMAGAVLLLVAHTWRDDGEDELVRIISVRRATKQERRAYEQGER